MKSKLFVNARFTVTKCDAHARTGGEGARSKHLTVYTTVKAGSEKARGYLCADHAGALVALDPANPVVLW